MEKVDLKNYKLEKKSDFIVYLRELITYSYRHLKDYKRYIDELNNVIEDNSLRNNITKRIPSALYTDTKNRLAGVEAHLVNIVGDLTNTALSYNKFRKLVDKRQSKVGDLGLDVLDKKIEKAICEVNVVRNWSLHVPESLLTAQLEITKKAISLKPNEYAPIPDNPIMPIHFVEYEAEWLISLYDEKLSNYKILSEIFQQMKKDYSKLLGESVRVFKRTIAVRSIKDMDVPKISYQIQQKKFKSIDEDIFLF